MYPFFVQEETQVCLESDLGHNTKRLGLGARSLGGGLGTLRHSVTSELTREDEANSGLDLAGREGGLLVVANKLAGLGGDALEDVVDEGVHDGHGALGDAGVGVDLLENLEDVRGVRLGALLTLAALLGGLLGALAGGGLGGGLGSNALAGSGRHVD